MEIHIFRHLDFLEGGIFCCCCCCCLSASLGNEGSSGFSTGRPGSILGQMEREKEEEGQVRRRLGDEGVDCSGIGLEPRGRTPTATRHTRPGCQPPAPPAVLTFYEDPARLTGPLLPLGIFTAPLLFCQTVSFFSCTKWRQS